MVKKLKFSLFENRNGVFGSLQTHPTAILNFKDLKEYYNSERNKKLSEDILTAPTTELKTALKNKRAYFTPSGVFSYRKNSSILHHNNIISIDIDGLKNRQEALEVKSKLIKHPSILLCVLSTRGEGVKGFMMVNKTYTPEEQHQQLKNVFKPYLQDFLQIDANCIDSAQFVLSQPCYFSYDAEMYVNEKATELNLDFNYRAPEPAPYKKIDVPANSINRVDAYISSILRNKVDSFDSGKPRHPQLFSAKLLGQLIHYAPNLESEIINTFIAAGVSMYGKENMRSNVTASVKRAFYDGVNAPINNKVLDSIITDQAPPEPPKKIVVNKPINYNLESKYLSEDLKLCNLIKSTILANKFTTITAPTGKGKSYLFSFLSEKFKEQSILLTPLTSIVNQQKDKFATITGINNPDEINLAQKEKIVFCTYGSAMKLEPATNKILIIDESHLLSDRSNILHYEQKAIYKLMIEAKHVVFVSATTNTNLSNIFGAKEIKISVKEKKKEIQPLFYDPQRTKQIDVVLKFIRDHKKGVNVIVWNNKSKLKLIKEDIIKLDILKDSQISKFTADTLDVKHENYNLLIDDQKIKENTKLILSTSKIGEGVNINNDEIFNILVVNNRDVNYFIQSIGRYRNAKELNIHTLFSEGFKSAKEVDYDSDYLYNVLLDDIKKIPKNFASLNKATANNLPLINIDWKERATIHIEGYETLINSFEILHQVKNIKESSFNFKTWKKAVIAVNGNIIFKEDAIISQPKNIEIEIYRKERKKVKENILEEIRGILDSKDAGSILCFVHENTKNLHLKKLIKELPFELKDTLNEDEKFNVYDNYNTIEKYVSNLLELKRATKKDYFTVSKIFFYNNNFKPANYSVLLKRYVAIKLKKNGPSNIAQQKTLHSIYKIEEVFQPEFKDSNILKINREDLFRIIRQDLKYRLRTLNTATVKDKLGFLFNIKYCKFTKYFILEKVAESSYQKGICLLEKKEKKVIQKTLASKGLKERLAVLNL